MARSGTAPNLEICKSHDHSPLSLQLAFPLLLLLLINAVQMPSATAQSCTRPPLTNCMNYLLMYNDNVEQKLKVLDGIVAQLAYTRLAEDENRGSDQQVY